MSTNVGCAHEYISSCQSEYKLLWISVTRILDRALDLASFKVLFSELIEAVHIIGENNHHDFMWKTSKYCVEDISAEVELEPGFLCNANCRCDVL